MRLASGLRLLSAIGIVGLLGVLLPGCTGGDTLPADGGGTTPPTDLVYRTPDSTKPTAIAGTLFTLAARPGETQGMIDQATGAAVSLTGQPDAAGAAPIARQTTSFIRGAFQFENLPQGTYTITAQVPYPIEQGRMLTGTLTGVRAIGNIPTLMTNLLLGEDAARMTFTGLVTQAGTPAIGATVSVDITAYTPDYLQGNSLDEVSVILSTTTDLQGRYQISVPALARSYYLAAHSTTSMVQSSEEFRTLIPGETRTVDFILRPAESPVFADLSVDHVTTTLPAPTALASQQAAMSRLALARALGAPATRVARLEKLVARPATRAAAGIVEHDLYWTVRSSDVGVRGFHIYRGSALTGPYVHVGSTRDPYQQFFFDNDPALPTAQAAFYRVTSYAANAKESAPSTPIFAVPLPQVAVTGPADNASLPRGSAQIQWQPVAGALSYVVLLYRATPTFNSVPVDPTVRSADATIAPLAGYWPGECWWSVAAFNSEDPNFATSVSFSAFRKLTLTE